MTNFAWIGESVEVDLTTAKWDAVFYNQCTYDNLTVKIGDCVLLKNNNNSDGSSIAKILYMYETSSSKREPHQAIVERYSRLTCVPPECTTDIIYDENRDVAIDSRYSNFKNYIAIESIVNKCEIKFIYNDDLTFSKVGKQKTDTLFYICRYELIQTERRWILGRITDNISKSDIKVLRPRKRQNLEYSPSSAGPRSTSISYTPHTKSYVNKENADSKKTPSKQNKNEPINKSNRLNDDDIIMILGDDTSNDCVYESPSKKSKSTFEDDDGYVYDYPYKSNCSKSQLDDISNACRNLNISFNDASCNTTQDSDILNYSIVDTPEKANNLNIVLKVSAKYSNGNKLVRQIYGNKNKSSPPKKNTPDKIEQPADVENTVSTSRKPRASVKLTPILSATPSIKLLTTPRKSILKTPTTRNADTPKRTVTITEKAKQFYVDSGFNKSPNRLAVTSSSPPTTPKSTRSQRTPNSKKKVTRVSALTPSVGKKEIPINRRTSNIHLARERLHVSAVPENLPCRQAEFQDILSFVQGKIIDECGGCMYISGVPGTGKTATVTEVINYLKKKAASKEIPPFEYVDINGMRLTEPRQAYVQINKQLTGKTVTWENAHTLLEKRFSTYAPRRVTTVLLVDELDILCNRRQDVVYNLLDWPTKHSAHLVVITIANTMDLPERLLKGKVSSRLGLTRLTFQPYSHKQLQEVIMSRLLGTNSFKVDAVQLVARKVASVSGDCRRALDICRRATEIAEDMNKTDSNILVSMVHVQQAIEEMIASPKVRAIKSLSKMEKLFLQAVVTEVQRTGVEEVIFNGVYTQLLSLAALMDIKPPIIGRTLMISAQLGASRLIICEHTRTGIHQKILLNVSPDDVHYALHANVN